MVTVDETRPRALLDSPTGRTAHCPLANPGSDRGKAGIEVHHMSKQRSTGGGQASPVIVWFRSDLRLADNPALSAAAASGRPIIPLYILDEQTPGIRPLGGAARWWLHHSLAALDASLRGVRSGARCALKLVLRRGAAADVLHGMIEATAASGVYCNRTYDPVLDALDGTLAGEFDRSGVKFECLGGTLLAEPGTLMTGSGGPFRVFTPFWNRLSALQIAKPLPVPRTFAGGEHARGDRLEEWGLLPRLDWDSGFAAAWRPGEQAGLARVRSFLTQQFEDYRATRDVPAIEGTSRLSPYLRFGELSARALWHTVLSTPDGGRAELTGNGFLRELGWREFAHYTLHHFPDLPQHALRREFEAFDWRDDAAGFEAWCHGRTGYPIVDAGMRELWQTGWMHNRVRMVTGSFLVKDLLIPWQRGERWFWDTLVDADRASNALNWQWVSGCGVDAAPYFRIFNPVTQSQKFDPDGDYVRRWLPELRGLPAPAIHAPWSAACEVLRAAGVRLGETYPRPIVDHGAARKRALARFEALRQRS